MTVARSQSGASTVYVKPFRVRSHRRGGRGRQGFRRVSSGGAKTSPRSRASSGYGRCSNSTPHSQSRCDRARAAAAGRPRGQGRGADQTRRGRTRSWGLTQFQDIAAARTRRSHRARSIWKESRGPAWLGPATTPGAGGRSGRRVVTGWVTWATRSRRSDPQCPHGSDSQPRPFHRARRAGKPAIGRLLC